MASEEHSSLDLDRPLTRRRLLVYGAGAMAAGALPGLAEPALAEASRAVKRGGTLKLAIGDVGSSDSLDPAIQFTGVGITSGGMVYDNLLHIDEAWNLTPMLASDWSRNAKATVWTFELRRGVQFHSGKTLTTQDVAEQIRRLLDKKTGSGGRGLLLPVLSPSGIVIRDPHTITFRLKVPDAFFGVKMAHYYTRIPQAGTRNWIKGSPGTGPFISKQFVVGSGYTVVRNPNYWRSGVPLLDSIHCVAIPELATKQQAVLSGDVDLSDSPAFAAVPQFEQSSVATLYRIPGGSTYTYDIDSSIKPYSDTRVSRAMKMLIDRKKALEFIVRGAGRVSADSLVPPTDPYYPSDLKPFPFDPEQAKSLLAQAGYASGFKDKIWTTTAYQGLNDGAVFAKAAWAAGGLDMEVESVSTDAYLKAFLHEPIVMDYYLRQHPALTLDLYYASTSPQNTTRIKDPKIDAWIREFKAATSKTRQKELMHAILHRYNDRAAEIVPFAFDELWPVKKRVRGLVPNPMSKLEWARIWLA